MQECACFGESTDGAGGVQEALRLDLAAAPIFSLAVDPAPAAGGRQQVKMSSIAPLSPAAAAGVLQLRSEM